MGQRIQLTPLAFNHWFDGWPGHPAVHPTTVAYSLGTAYQVFQNEAARLQEAFPKQYAKAMK